uniref:Uncharacterized protein n=1 Tax=Anguilla anguilla TaxID=7936 RepID=A0A0E9XHP1_ANGAN
MPVMQCNVMLCLLYTALLPATTPELQWHQGITCQAQHTHNATHITCKWCRQTH